MFGNIRCSKSISWQIEPNLDLVYIFNHKSSKWFYFDGVSRKIWESLVLDENSFEQTVRNISTGYEVEYDVVLEDTKEFIKELIDEDVVVNA